MTGQNIIMVCQQNWNLEIDSSARNLAKAFACHNNVLYVNAPLDVNTLLRGHATAEVREKLRVVLGQQSGLAQAEPNLWVYTPEVLCISANWLSSKKLFSQINSFNSYLLARSIMKAAKQLGFDGYYVVQDGILFHGLELPSQLSARQYVYYLRDFTITVPYFRRHGPWVEAQLIQRANVVVTNTAYLLKYIQQYNPDHSYIIGQGCVLTLYDANATYELPADLANLPGPLIGYTGLLTTLRLDIDLLLTIARRHPEWHLVLIGPEDDDFRNCELHRLPNVHFLGRKPPEALPAYLCYLDVCINPQVLNDLTLGNYPLKIDEYLAMGKPVVATRTPGMMMFQDYVYLAEGEQEWLSQLEQALRPPIPEETAARIGFAQTHTWAACAQRVYAAIAEVEEVVPVAPLPT